MATTGFVTVLPEKLPELGRIRMGNQIKGTTKSGNEYLRPNKLESFRLTSPNPTLLHFAKDKLEWGGEVQQWEDAPSEGQWELYTTRSSLLVVVPPDSVFSQFNEVWSGGGCEVRCDGQKIISAGAGGPKSVFKWSEAKAAEQVGQGCICAGMEEPACKTVSRLNVMLPEMPGLGTWRLETRSYYGGSELPSIVRFLQAQSQVGNFIKCWLTCEERTVKRNGKTNKFMVAGLQPCELTMMDLLSGSIPSGAMLNSVPRTRQIEPAQAPSYEEAMATLGYEEEPHQPEQTHAKPEQGGAPYNPRNAPPEILELKRLLAHYKVSNDKTTDMLTAVNPDHRSIFDLSVDEAEALVMGLVQAHEKQEGEQ